MTTEGLTSPTDSDTPRAAPLAEIPWWVSALFALAVLIALTFSLGMGALAEPDEPRYAEIAREILVRNDWVTPTLNFVKYFEKPPLVYWLTALTFRLFGVSDAVARLVPVLSTLGTLVLTWMIGRHGFNRWVAAVGTAVLATSPFFFAMGQTLTLDAPLTTCLTAGLVCFWFGYHTPARRPLLYRTMYLCLALGVLTKGPVAVVLTGAVIAGFLVVMRDGRALRPLLDPIGIGLFFLVALPWHVLVSLRNPEFPDFFIMDQHVRRFLAPHEHQQPIWFFLPFVFATMLPWSLVLALARGWWPAVRRPRTWSPSTWFCLIWASVVIGFFSLSASKLLTYVLPGLPPLALLTARALHTVLAGGSPLGRRLGMGFIVLGWVMLAGGAVAALLQVDPIALRILPSVCAGGVVMVATGTLMRRLRDSQRSFAVALCGMLALLSAAIAGRGVTTSYRELGRIIHEKAGPNDQIVVYGHYVQGIPLYTERRVIMVHDWGELNFGSRQGDQRAFFWRDDEQLVRAWASPMRLFLVINWYELDPLRPRLVPPPIEIAAEGKKRVIINHPLP